MEARESDAEVELYREELLSLYQHAARAIAERPLDEKDREAPHHSSQWPSSDAASSTTGEEQATQELLQRQAALTLRIHEAFRSDGSCHVSGLDEVLLQRRLDDLVSIAWTKLYAYRYDRVPAHWRRLYCDALILSTHSHVLRALAARGFLPEDALDLIVECLDRALIVTGGTGKLGAAWIEKTLQTMEALCKVHIEAGRGARELSGSSTAWPATFSDNEPYGRPRLSASRQCPRHEGWSLEKFERYMNEGKPGGPQPVVFQDLIGCWPALTDRHWNQPSYLLSRTLGGRRLVPVEIGRSYVDEGWGQEVIRFRDFLERYVAPPPTTEGEVAGSPRAQTPVGYLAQHDLFCQLPALRNDIQIPDFCWASVPAPPTELSRALPPLEMPQLNAWFGPARTITPLHTDPYHNLLCQVVGAKYVRLYPPQATPHMRPRRWELGVDMSNTSEIDVGILEGWDEAPDGVDQVALRNLRNSLEGVEYKECILSPGETLLIPMGWWHYVRSLRISFSVSFWWN